MNFPSRVFPMNTEKVNYLSDMCVQGRFVTNRYTGQQFWCKCGKCKSCLQEKASMRSQRIRYEYDGVTPVYFVTLTYDRLSCPYIDYNEYLDLKQKGYGDLHVYRSYSIKWNVKRQRYSKSWHRDLLCSVPVELTSYDCNWLPFLKKQPNKVGVCYFKDLQDFEKRLRIRLKRQGYEEKIRLFNVTEYGGTSFRPHCHVLLWSKIAPEKLRDAVIASWPFGRRISDPKSFELVYKDPAGYVSSYVNSGEKLPSFLTRYFKSRHSASKYFGHGLRAFSLEEVEKKVPTGVVSYVFTRTGSNGQVVFDNPVPKYVINRYFPLFKGYSRLSRDKVFDYISSGFRRSVLRQSERVFANEQPKYRIDYSDDDIHKIGIRLNHAFDYWLRFHPDSSLIDYAIAYFRTWDAWKSTCFRYFRMDDTVPDFYKFDNVCLLSEDKQVALWDSCFHDIPFIVDNNRKPFVISKTIKMAKMYDKYTKQKDITNMILSSDGYGF